ncbi:MAG: hypothetical protein NTW52_01590 [Planctomycetota bacterium]|nr:hypothetical protein [Planctomycetota bacterium]
MKSLSDHRVWKEKAGDKDVEHITQEGLQKVYAIANNPACISEWKFRHESGGLPHPAEMYRPAGCIFRTSKSPPKPIANANFKQ